MILVWERLLCYITSVEDKEEYPVWEKISNVRTSRRIVDNKKLGIERDRRMRVESMRRMIEWERRVMIIRMISYMTT